MSTPAWISQLQKASFRGVPFQFKSAPGKGGRSLVRHDYPDADAYDVEDLGKKARELTIEAYVIGANYMVLRDNLINALEQPGAGSLVHPYLGTINAGVPDYNWEDSTESGGMATFSIQFLPWQNSNLPAQTVSTQAAVAGQVALVRSLQTAQLLKVFNVENYIVNSEAFGQLTSLLSNFNIAQSEIQAAVAAPSAVIALMQGLVDPLGLALSQVTGSASGGSIVITSQTTSASGSASQSVMPTAVSMSGTFAFLQQTASATTTSRASTPVSVANRAALTTALQLEAIITACQLSSNVSYASYNDAIAERDQLFDTLDLIENDVDDDVYVALQDLRAVVQQDIVSRAADLARISTVTPQVSLPSFALAQQLYGPIDIEASAADLVSRNDIANPVFMPSGVPLEVLSAWSSS